MKWCKTFLLISSKISRFDYITGKKRCHVKRSQKLVSNRTEIHLWLQIKCCKKSWLIEKYRNTEFTELQKHRNTEIQKYWNTEVLNKRSTEIQNNRNKEVLKSRSREIQNNRNTEVLKYRNTEIHFWWERGTADQVLQKKSRLLSFQLYRLGESC